MKKSHKIALIMLIAALLILERYAFINLLNFKELFRQGLVNEGLDEDQMALSLQMQSWLIPISIIMKLLSILFVSGLIYLGCLLFDYGKKFKAIYVVVFLSETVFILAKGLNFLVLQSRLSDITNLEYLKKYQVLSAQHFFDYHSVSESVFSALGTISIFQILYCLGLAYGLKLIINKSFMKSFEVILYSYVSVFTLMTLGKILVGLNFS